MLFRHDIGCHGVFHHVFLSPRVRHFDTFQLFLEEFLEYICLSRIRDDVLLHAPPDECLRFGSNYFPSPLVAFDDSPVVVNNQDHLERVIEGLSELVVLCLELVVRIGCWQARCCARE
jgi:hypothetical protein